MLRFEYKLSLFGSIVEGSHRLGFYGVVPFYDKPIAWAFFDSTHVLNDPLAFPLALFLTVQPSFSQEKTVDSAWIASPGGNAVVLPKYCGLLLFYLLSSKVGIYCLLTSVYSNHLCPCRLQFLVVASQTNLVQS